MFKKYLPTLMTMFSCIILLYFFYKLPQLLYLGWYKVGGPGLFVFSVQLSNWPSPTYLFPLNCSGVFPSQMRCRRLGHLFWTLISIILVSLCILVTVLHCLNIFGFLVCFISSGLNALALFYFFSISLGILGPLHFHINLRISLSISTQLPNKKEKRLGFYWNCPEFINQFSENWYLNNIEFSSQWLGYTLLFT